MEGLNIKAFIIEWNNKYPFDRYIRKKYGIVFGSIQHKTLNFIDMAIEFAEDRIVRTEQEKWMQEEEKTLWDSFLPGSAKEMENQGLKVIKLKKKEIDLEFENLDITKY